MKVEVSEGEAAAPAEPDERRQEGEEAASRRALSDPEVRRFQDLFSDSQVRAVRDLKQ